MPYHQQHPAVLMLVANRKDVAKILNQNEENVKRKMDFGTLTAENASSGVPSGTEDAENTEY